MVLHWFVLSEFVNLDFKIGGVKLFQKFIQKDLFLTNFDVCCLQSLSVASRWQWRKFKKDIYVDVDFPSYHFIINQSINRLPFYYGAWVMASWDAANAARMVDIWYSLSASSLFFEPFLLPFDPLYNVVLIPRSHIPSEVLLLVCTREGHAVFI